MYLEVKDLNFKYKHAEDDTLMNFNLCIDKGEILSILGESGSGKSTVLRLIAGLEVPSNGTIKINHKTIVDNSIFLSPEKRNIGMVFQDYALFPHMTVSENIKFGLKKISKAEKNERLKEVLELTELDNFKDRYPYELSGGQQQRVALARALAPKPLLMLLDEPFSNLDAELQTKIGNDLKKILKQTGVTTIFVTHDKEEAKRISDSVIILKEGQIIQTGKVQDMLN